MFALSCGLAVAHWYLYVYCGLCWFVSLNFLVVVLLFNCVWVAFFSCVWWLFCGLMIVAVWYCIISLVVLVWCLFTCFKVGVLFGYSWCLLLGFVCWVLRMF